MSHSGKESITNRTLHSSVYNLIGSVITIALGAVRLALLLYFLLPEDFGIYAQAFIFVALSGQFRLPGLDLAIIQRKSLSSIDRQTYFLLKTGFLVTSLFFFVTATPFIARFYPGMPDLKVVLWVLLGIELWKGLFGYQESLLRRQLNFRPIATANVGSAIVATIVAPYLAWRGFGVWSLVAEAMAAHFVRGIIMWGMSRIWWPLPAWNRQVAHELWRFSSRLWGTITLTFFTDRFDDFWIGTYLGAAPLGFYSRAYEVARYPRRIIAVPLGAVFFSTYSRLQEDKIRLTQAFFRLTSVMVRASFLLSVALVLTAPELFSLLGEKWQPMLLVFQILIIYSLLDPLAIGARDLLISLGHPEIPFRIKILQSVIFIPTVILLGATLGIVGVAIAANIMVFIGTVALYYYSQRFIEYSAWRLWFWPLFSALVTTIIVLTLGKVWTAMPFWYTFLGKLGVIVISYGGLILAKERKEFLNSAQFIWRKIQPLIRRNNP